MATQLKYWGWGYEGDGLSPCDREALLSTFAADFGIHPSGDCGVPRLDELTLPPPRMEPPTSLAAICTQEPYERILHSFGQSQPDSIRIFARDFAHAPDVVAYPRDEADVMAVLEWAGEAGAALIPFGGGSSVVGGVTPDIDDRYTATVTLDMSRMNRVLEVDPVSRSARIQGGARGPELEAALKTARGNAPPLPPVLPAFHPGRMDRYPVRRSLRDPVHPYRRPGGERDHGHTGGQDGVAPASGVGCRSESRPAGHWL